MGCLNSKDQTSNAVITVQQKGQSLSNDAAKMRNLAQDLNSSVSDPDIQEEAPRTSQQPRQSAQTWNNNDYGGVEAQSKSTNNRSFQNQAAASRSSQRSQPQQRDQTGMQEAYQSAEQTHNAKNPNYEEQWPSEYQRSHPATNQAPAIAPQDSPDRQYSSNQAYGTSAQVISSPSEQPAQMTNLGSGRTNDVYAPYQQSSEGKNAHSSPNPNIEVDRSRVRIASKDSAIPTQASLDEPGNNRADQAKKEARRVQPAIISFEVKQIFDGYGGKGKNAADPTTDFLLNDFNYNVGDYGQGGHGIRSSPDSEQTSFGIKSSNILGGNRNSAAKIHTTPVDAHMKREEIDMDELNALLGLDDDRFNDKFEEMVNKKPNQASIGSSLRQSTQAGDNYSNGGNLTNAPSQNQLNGSNSQQKSLKFSERHQLKQGQSTLVQEESDRFYM